MNLWLLEDFCHLQKTNKERFWLILINFFQCAYAGQVLLYSILNSYLFSILDLSLKLMFSKESASPSHDLFLNLLKGDKKCSGMLAVLWNSSMLNSLCVCVHVLGLSRKNAEGWPLFQGKKGNSATLCSQVWSVSVKEGRKFAASTWSSVPDEERRTCARFQWFLVGSANWILVVVDIIKSLHDISS